MCHTATLHSGAYQVDSLRPSPAERLIIAPHVSEGAQRWVEGVPEEQMARKEKNIPLCRRPGDPQEPGFGSVGWKSARSATERYKRTRLHKATRTKGSWCQILPKYQ